MAQASTDGKVCYPIGKLNQATFAVIRDGQIQVTFGGGDGGRTGVATFICDKTASDPVYEAVGENNNNPGYYPVTITAAQACAGAGGGASAAAGEAGWVVVGIVLGGFSAYMLVGFAFLKYSRGQSGTDAVPNYGFWTSLPGLSKDGFSFVMGKVRGVGGGSAGGGGSGYASI